MPQANPKKDYYDILGVEEDASQEEIKNAYKRLAKKYHPDRSDESNAEEKFKEIGEAYAVLKDPDKRKKYDQYRKYGQSPGQSGFQFDAEGFDFFDLFQQVAGGPGGRGRRQRRGRQRRGGVNEEIFEEVFGGGGFGNGPGGGGRSRVQWGAGRQPRDTASERPSRVVELERRIPLKLALLGGKLKVRTPEGEMVKLTIKPGTQPGDKLRVPNKGGRGRDLIVKLDVKIPKNLSEEQKRVIREHF